MLEQVKCWGLLIHRHFLYVCHYIVFHIKRYGSISAGRSPSKRDGDRMSSRQEKSVQFQKTPFNGNHTLANNSVKIKPSSDIPGPKSVPVFGTLFDFNKFGSTRIHELAVARHSEYGDIFREKLLSQELVFVASTELLKQWMTKEGKYPVSLKQEPSLVFAECCPYLKRGLFFRNGEEWYQLRKLGLAIVHKNTSDFETHGLFVGCEAFLENYMRDLRKVVQNGDGNVTDLETRSYDIAVGALLSVVYGTSAANFKDYTGRDYSTLSRNAHELNACHQQLLEIPVRVAKWFRMPAWTNYSEKLKDNLTACQQFFKMSRKEVLKSPETASMRSHGLFYKTIGFPASYQDDVEVLLTDFAVDTKDPFAATVMFLTYVLGMYPDIQEKILTEVSLVYPSSQPITYRNSRNLAYTEGFLKEVLRLYPVAAFAARVASEDTLLGDYLVKSGAMIMYSTFVAHRDPRYFSEPLKLMPERWFSKDTNSGITCDASAFAPFGVKSRACLGQQLASSIFLIYIANLVRNFKLISPEPLEITMRTVLYPKDLKPIKLEMR